MDADELGGVEEVLQAYEKDGFSSYAQNGENDEWPMLEFVLEDDDEAIVTVTVSGVSNLGSFAAATNAGVFRQLTVPPLPNHRHSPTYRHSHACARAQLRAIAAAVYASAHGRAEGCQPTRASSLSLQGAAKRLLLRAHARTIPVTAKQPASLSPTFREFVSDPPLWALILTIVGAVMALTGRGLISVPPWIRRRLSFIR